MVTQKVVAVVELSLEELQVVKKLRECEFGKITVNMLNGNIAKITIEKTEVVNEANGMEIAARMGTEIKTIPLVTRPQTTDAAGLNGHSTLQSTGNVQH